MESGAGEFRQVALDRRELAATKTGRIRALLVTWVELRLGSS
jgi:hypothetical protein